MGKNISKLKGSTAFAESMPKATVRYETVPTGSLKPNPLNPRTHGKRQLREIARSYQEFGVINPLIVAPDYTILAGHGRFAAAQLLGLSQLSVAVVHGLTPAQQKAYALADNKLADMSSFDMKLVLLEVEAIVAEDAAFDLTHTGFCTAELDALSGAARTAELNDLEDDPPLVPPRNPVSRVGNLWGLGDHRIINGDWTDPDLARN